MDWLSARWSEAMNLEVFDYLVFTTNLLIFLFSKQIVKAFRPSKDADATRKRLYTLRFINFVLFGLYFVVFFLVDIARQISQTGLTLLLGYLASHFLQFFTIRRFGRVREIEGEAVLTETYQSEIFGLLGGLVAAITAFLVIINIWGMTDWLKATSVLGGLLIIAFSTKDVWAPDNIHGLILLYNGDIESGSVVRVEEHDLLGVVVQITLTQTTFRDLRRRHQIVLPNSLLRRSKIEILSNCPAKGIDQFVDYNLAYGLSGDRVRDFFFEVWQRACELQSAINPEKKPRVRLAATGDHAVTWRFYYTVKNVYKILEARFAVNRAAYDCSLEWGIGLNTPLTHQILSLPESGQAPGAPHTNTDSSGIEPAQKMPGEINGEGNNRK